MGCSRAARWWTDLRDWGYKGIAVGDVVNDLSALVGDPNVSIHEAKAFVCNVTRA
ncbi:MAG TPA: hypothetical protein VNL77_17965 [Roseiflexaceae bacterium]|nr:hypothetical protein [Roseiflexaceae bacterium]